LKRVKCKFVINKHFDTCYSASYTSQTGEQKRFTISELADDWYELMIPQRTVRHIDRIILHQRFAPSYQPCLLYNAVFEL